MTLTCPDCGKELPDDAKFCGACGTPVAVEEKMPDCCANCFAELPEGVKFCLQCGKPAVVAQNYPSPERDEAIYKELDNTAPRFVKYRKRVAIKEATGEYPIEDDDIEDFEQNKATIAMRARKWVDYETSGMERIHYFQELIFQSIRYDIDVCFGMESHRFETNKPNHHKALFSEEFLNYYLYKLQKHGALTWDDPPQPTPLFFDYLRKVVGWEDEYIKEFKFKPPDLDEIRAMAAKDDELFPPPEPQRVEVAGAILNFMSNEGVLVVYMDCSQAGKKVHIDFEDVQISLACDYQQKEAEILERSESGTPICAAIFNHIPFVTDTHRNRQEVLHQLHVSLQFSPAASIKWEEKVTLFRGQVTELDWRWKK